MWIAKDKNGEVYAFDKKPVYKEDGWLSIQEKDYSFVKLPFSATRFVYNKIYEVKEIINK